VSDRRIELIVNLLQVRPLAAFSLDDLARTVNLSESRLRHLFKAETGHSLTAHIRLLKMEAARDLLENTFLSIKEVMVRVGFSDESHFVRDFQRVYGLSPRRYRQARRS